MVRGRQEGRERKRERKRQIDTTHTHTHTHSQILVQASGKTEFLFTEMGKTAEKLNQRGK